jgi:hypothetical protein
VCVWSGWLEWDLLEWSSGGVGCVHSLAAGVKVLDLQHVAVFSYWTCWLSF